MKRIWESKLQYNNSQDTNSIVSPPSKKTQQLAGVLGLLPTKSLTRGKKVQAVEKPFLHANI